MIVTGLLSGFQVSSEAGEEAGDALPGLLQSGEPSADICRVAACLFPAVYKGTRLAAWRSGAGRGAVGWLLSSD